MNLYTEDLEAFDLLEQNDFVQIEDLKGKNTTTAASFNIYDHIFFYNRSEYPALQETNKGGVFNMFDTVFTDPQANEPAYVEYIDEL